MSTTIELFKKQIKKQSYSPNLSFSDCPKRKQTLHCTLEGTYLKPHLKYLEDVVDHKIGTTLGYLL